MAISTVSTSNEEVDRQLGGGLPLPSLILIEGEHGSGKSALTAQFMKGLLDSRNKVLFITTESTIKEYITKMKMITYNFSRHFLRNNLLILAIQLDGITWSEKLSRYLLPVISKYMNMSSHKYNVAVIDSLSLLTMHSNQDVTMDFFTECKRLVSNGISIIITVHPHAISEEVGLRMRSTCDGYVRLSTANIAGKSVKLAEIVKLHGSSSQVSSQFSFDVDQTFGIKIVPISLANA